MEIFQTMGIIALLLISGGMLWWQQRMWDASDAKRYYSKPPPDYIRFEIITHYPLRDNYVRHVIDEFVFALADAMGYEGGGYSNDEKIEYHFEGMPVDKAEKMEKMVNLFLHSIGYIAYAVSWQHFNSYEEEEKEEEDDHVHD